LGLTNTQPEDGHVITRKTPFCIPACQLRSIQKFTIEQRISYLLLAVIKPIITQRDLMEVDTSD